MTDEKNELYTNQFIQQGGHYHPHSLTLARREGRITHGVPVILSVRKVQPLHLTAHEEGNLNSFAAILSGILRFEGHIARTGTYADVDMQVEFDQDVGGGSKRVSEDDARSRIEQSMIKRSSTTTSIESRLNA
ncbi:MAG TPA: hypothetical protein VLE19_12015 [Pyrinomonadaceae bacterium]|nr:hypothetical protein [Pyrinomonadaceae bacterium]